MINKYVVTYGIYLYFDVEITQFNRNISFKFGENLNISCIHISHLYHFFFESTFIIIISRSYNSKTYADFDIIKWQV
jgi:hypothetical protein